MKFPDLIFGRFVRRYKRFFADFELADGSVVTAHCANPGSMKSIIEHAPFGYLSPARPERKLRYTWELAVLAGTEPEQPAYVYVNPSGANRIVAEAIEQRIIEELNGYDLILPEVKYGNKSRVDFVLHGNPGRAYVEVKNVTLSVGGGRGAFPDAVTDRGTRHLVDLVEVVRAGHRGVLLFCAGRTDIRSVEVAASIDPVYAKTLRWAAQSGVEVLAYTGKMDRFEFKLDRRLPVELPDAEHGE